MVEWQERSVGVPQSVMVIIVRVAVISRPIRILARLVCWHEAGLVERSVQHAFERRVLTGLRTVINNFDLAQDLTFSDFTSLFDHIFESLRLRKLSFHILTGLAGADVGYSNPRFYDPFGCCITP